MSEQTEQAQRTVRLTLPRGVSVERITLIQKADCCQSEDDVQRLEIAIEDGGGGSFLLLKTDRWACESGTDIGLILAELAKETMPC